MVLTFNNLLIWVLDKSITYHWLIILLIAVRRLLLYAIKPLLDLEG
jgi:hypothetical protein